MILFGCVIWVCYLGVGERGVCRGHVVHLGEPKQLHRSFVIGEVLCNVIFSRHFADDTGFMHVSVFSLCTWHGSVRLFFGYVQLLAWHLQVLFSCIFWKPCLTYFFVFLLCCSNPVQICGSDIVGFQWIKKNCSGYTYMLNDCFRRVSLGWK